MYKHQHADVRITPSAHLWKEDDSNRYNDGLFSVGGKKEQKTVCSASWMCLHSIFTINMLNNVNYTVCDA